MEKIWLVESRNDEYDYYNVVCACSNAKTAELKRKHFELMAKGNDYYTVKDVILWKATDNKWLESQIKLEENSKLPF